MNWKGQTEFGTWNTSDASFWDNPYSDGSSVVFSVPSVVNSETHRQTVILGGELSPGSILLTTEKDKNYIFTGDGLLKGDGGLTKSGEGELLIANNAVNAYKGKTVVNGGLLEFRNRAFGGCTGDVEVAEGATFKLDSYAANKMIINGSLEFAFSGTVPNDLASLTNVTWGANSRLVISSGIAITNTNQQYLHTTRLVVKEGAAYALSWDCENLEGNRYSVEIGGQGVLVDGQYTGALYTTYCPAYYYGYLNEMALSSDALVKLKENDNPASLVGLDILDFKLNGHKLTISGRNTVLIVGLFSRALDVTIDKGTISMDGTLFYGRNGQSYTAPFGTEETTIELCGPRSCFLLNTYFPRIGANIILNNEGRDESLPYDINNYSYIFETAGVTVTMPEFLGKLTIIKGGVLKLDGAASNFAYSAQSNGNHMIFSGGLDGTGSLYVDATGGHYTQPEDFVDPFYRARHLYLGGEISGTIDGIVLLGNAVLQLGTYQTILTNAVMKNASIEEGLTITAGEKNVVKIVPTGSAPVYNGLNFVKSDAVGTSLLLRQSPEIFPVELKDTKGSLNHLVLERDSRLTLSGSETNLTIDSLQIKETGSGLSIGGGKVTFKILDFVTAQPANSLGEIEQTGGQVNVETLTLGFKNASGGNYVLQGGVLNVGTLSLLADSAEGTVPLEIHAGTRLNPGAGGIQSFHGLVFAAGGTLGALADWQTLAELILSATEEEKMVVIDTNLFSESGGVAEIQLKGQISGDGGLKIKGEGGLVLTGENRYEGDTVFESGNLYVGNDFALGTGKLVIKSGAVLSSLSGAVNLSNGADFGMNVEGEGDTLVFGSEGHTGSLTLGGAINVAYNITHLETWADLGLGSVVSDSEEQVKTGTGRLTFSGTLDGIKAFDVRQGMLVFGAGEADMGSVQKIQVSEGCGLDLGGRSGKGSIVFVNTGTLAGMSGHAGRMDLALEGTTDRTRSPWMVSAKGDVAVKDLHFNSRNARLTTDGTFSAESVSFLLGDFNEVSSKNANATLITATDATVTGTEKGSIYLDFDLTYVRENMDRGGKFQLFSTGLDYRDGSIQYTQRQEISIDASALASDGSVSWTRIKLQGLLLSSDYMPGTYTPSNNVEYLGAEANGGTPIKVGPSVVYEFDDADILAYKLTPGKGTLIYQGILDKADKGLDVMDYASITMNAADQSQGNVTLTNNGNSYGGGTNVSGTTLVVDLSQGENPGLADQATGGNLDVKALGTGEVTVTASLMGYAGTLRLQSYGDVTLDGVTTYTYANDFRLKDGSSLVQGGGNDQILTGDVTLETGMNAIRNESGKSLTLKGNVTQTTGTGLVLENTNSAGKIKLDGSGKNLTVSQLEIRGEGKVDITNGYTANVREVRMTGGTLTVETQSELMIGQGGINGNGTFALNGGTLKSATSWQSDTAITLGTGSNTINTGGANVKLVMGTTGEGGFIKQGTGFLYLYDNAGGNAKGLMDIRQGRLILLGAYHPENARMATDPASEYKLNGDLTLAGGKGAGLQGKINADGHNVTFGEKTHFYLEVEGEKGVSGYIRDAGTITIGTGTQLHVDVLDDSWKTSQTYAIFSGREDIVGGGNLELTLGDEYAFVDVGLDLSNSKEIGLYLTKKGGTPGGGSSLTGVGENAGSIHTVVALLAAGVLDDSVELTGKLKQHMQKVSKMTTTEYKTYLTDMGNSASSFYTALSAQVQDATQHINSVRNRVELINPVMYDDWTQGGIYNVWAGGINHYRDVKSGSESPGYEMTSWGGELGCAIPLSQSFMIGVGFAYTFSDVQVKDGWGNNDNDTYNVDFFARYRSEGWTITGVLTGGFTNTEYHRNQILKDELLRANSSTDGNQFLGTVEVGYDFYLNEEKSWILQPLVNITAGRAKLDSLSETGEMKNAGLLIGSQSYNMFSAGVGAKLAYQYKNSVSDQPGRVELKAMYVNDMGDVDFEVNGRFLGAPGKGFDLKGVSNERSAAIVSAGWIAPISAYGQFFVDAGCEFRKDQNGVNTTVGFSFQF